MQNISSLTQKMQADCNATKIADPERFIADFLNGVKNDTDTYDRFCRFLLGASRLHETLESRNAEQGYSCTQEDIVRMAFASAMNDFLLHTTKRSTAKCFSSL